jgi:hypothetical protein
VLEMPTATGASNRIASLTGDRCGAAWSRIRMSASRAQPVLRRPALAFIEQARAFHRVAMNMSGGSAALPLYYCALNLAKAELLLANVTSPTGKQRHGLSHDPALASQLRTEGVAIMAQGVFPSLYRARTGRATGIIGSARVRLTDQLFRIGDVHSEMSVSGLSGEITRALAQLQLLEHGGQFRGELTIWKGVGEETWITSRRPTAAAFRAEMNAAFQRVHGPPDQYKLETRRRWPTRVEAERGIGSLIAPYAMQGTLPRSVVQPGITVLRPGVRTKDATRNRIVGELLLPLPDHLARYLFIFLMSSIVRYTPARFEASADSYLKAIVDLAIDEARVTVLLDSAFFISRVIID